MSWPSNTGLIYPKAVIVFPEYLLLKGGAGFLPKQHSCLPIAMAKTHMPSTAASGCAVAYSVILPGTHLQKCPS